MGDSLRAADAPPEDSVGFLSSARFRLTLSYAGFLLVAGVALFALLFYLIRFVPDEYLTGESGYAPNRSDLLRALWPRLWQVGLVLAVIGLVGGWFLAGRMLRPLQRINAVARRVSTGAFDQRVQLRGPHDEFRQLAETFDSMLDRLQRSFDEQRRFAANASHELRTPYAIERMMLDVAVANPDGVDVRRLVERLDATNRRGIEIVEALLALASLEEGRALTRGPVDLDELVSDVVEGLRSVAETGGISVWTSLGESYLDGNDALLRQLVSNLVLNGIRHNTGAGGRVEARVRTLQDGAVELVVVNTGPVVPSELLGTLTEPFVRGVGRVAGGRAGAEGSGLGLALVARIVEAHAARLELHAPETGGLVVAVRFKGPAAD
ncbi:sensor histidine kinase [Plantibacter sp. YIM 135249]|uniref:sensor histidine kinase n=1 Tax=Plantibacter sp. YIM 135249 TaxID=3423918 RepID=UPI003D327DF3